MKLICEHIDAEVEYLTEGVGAAKQVYVQGIFMQADKVNKNGRAYSKKILEGAVSKYVTEQVRTGRAVGELNHPSGPTINLDKVSHRIVDLQWEGNNVKGKALVLDTPMGKIVKNLIEGGVQLGVSSRGMGTLERQQGFMAVKPDFALCTVDIVQDPSASEAFVNGIMESTEWYYDNGILTARQIENYKTEIKRASIQHLTEAQEKVWRDFLSNL